MLRRFPAWWLVLFAALLLSACREPTDEESLLEAIDATEVHLYAALKLPVFEHARRVMASINQVATPGAGWWPSVKSWAGSMWDRVVQ